MPRGAFHQREWSAAKQRWVRSDVPWWGPVGSDRRRPDFEPERWLGHWDAPGQIRHHRHPVRKRMFSIAEIQQRRLEQLRRRWPYMQIARFHRMPWWNGRYC